MSSALHRDRVPRTPWPVALVARRWRAQWRLQTALLLVATTAAAALCALVPLVAATEPPVVRTAIRALPPAATAVDVEVLRPADDPEALRRRVGGALGRALGTAAPPSSAVVLTQPLRTTGVPGGALAALAAVDSPAEVAALVAGSWPAPGSREAAVPQAAARALGLRAGDRLTLAADAAPLLTVRVSGVYRPRLDAALWQLDPLRGAGEDPAFVDPDTPLVRPAQAIGPLLVARGALGGMDAPVAVAQLRFAPGLTGVGPAGLRAAADRLAGVDQVVTAGIGAGALSVGVVTAAPAALRGVADGLAATRALVVTAGGLLVALTLAVVLVTARLLAVARAGEQRVLVERGAGRRHVVGLAVLEALGTGLLVALLAPVPAVLLYRVLVAGPGAAAAGVPATVGVSPAVAAVAAASGLVLAGVLTAAALRPPARDRAGRGSRISAAARSGVDVVVLLLALVLLQRLLAASGPPTGVALAAPVALLLAAALTGLRLVAVVGRLLEPVAARSRSAVVAVAAFELSRRPQRSAAAVLVVALGLGSCAFGAAQLQTWERSQRAQAVVAAGVPLRAAASGRRAAPAAAVRAADPGAGLVVRQQALLTAGDPGADGTTAALSAIAAPREARALLAGAGTVLRDAPAGPAAVPEPRLTGGLLTLDVAASSSAARLPQTATIAALLRTADGRVVQSAAAALDPRGVRIPVPGAVRLVGLTLAVPAVDAALRVRIRSARADGAVLPRRPWSVSSTDSVTARLAAAGGDFADLTVVGAAGAAGRTGAVRLLGFPPASDAVPVVLDRATARTLGVATGAAAQLLLGDLRVPVTVAGTVAAVPASAPVAASAAGTAGVRPALLVDREALQRALLAQGRLLADGAADQEWWLAPSGGEATALRSFGPGADAVGVDALTARLQDGPLRVVVRPAVLLLIGTGALLTVVAFAVQAAAARHDRRFDLAQLRAAGATRPELARLDALVAAVLMLLGGAVGVPAAVLIASWTAPRLITGPDGGVPVPAVVFDPAAGALVALLGAAAVVLLGVAVVTALVADRGGTARLIRIGGEP